MWRKTGSFSLVLAAVILAGGCRATMHPNSAHNAAARNIIFNPSWSYLPAFDVPRREWPTTVGYQWSTEQLVYREVVIDRQGRFGGRGDWLYRRFDSVRTGRGYR